MTRERRALDLEIRVKGRKLEGYAATFGTEARIGDFTETIAPGAFGAGLGTGNDILALIDHDPRAVLARTKAGTLRLAEDSRGLAFDLDVPKTSYGDDILALVESRNAGGMSFAFTVDPDGEEWRGDKRTLKSVTLHEISAVSAWPAYEGTVVNARARALTAGAPRLANARRLLDILEAG